MARNATEFSGVLGVRVISVQYSDAIEAARSRVSASGVGNFNDAPWTLITSSPGGWLIAPGPCLG